MALSVIYFLFGFAFSSCNAVDSLRFFVIGDVGGLPLEPYTTYVERSTAAEMGKLADIYKPEFILELGDNFYTEGVTNSSDKRFQETFENVFTAPSLQVPWYFIAGNHDHYGNASAQIEYSKLSKRWNFPDYYYYKEFPVGQNKTLGLVMIDTVQLCGMTHDDVLMQPTGPMDVDKANQQWQFIVDALSRSKADYLFVAGHYPIYSVAEHGPTATLVKELLPLIDKYQANGYLCGHDHTLQHLRTKSTIGRNIDYFVSGMANYINLSTEHNEAVPKGSSLFHYANLFSKGGFLYAEATPSNMTLTFINSNGNRLYSANVFPRKR